MQFLSMLLSSSLSKLVVSVPSNLEPIANEDNWFIGVLLFVGLLLLALSRMFETHYLKGIIVNYFTLSGSTNIHKADIKLTSPSSIFLLINYFICSWICILLFAKTLFADSSLSFEFTSAYPILITGLIAFLLLAYQFVGIGLATWITGEPGYFKEQAIQFLAGFEFAGLLYFFLGLIWFLNPELKNQLFFIFISILLLILLIRLVKGIIISLLQGISWYYIILYFCTLEILPLLVTFYYVEMNFKL